MKSAEFSIRISGSFSPPRIKLTGGLVWLGSVDSITAPSSGTEVEATPSVTQHSPRSVVWMDGFFPIGDPAGHTYLAC